MCARTCDTSQAAQSNLPAINTNPHAPRAEQKPRLSPLGRVDRERKRRRETETDRQTDRQTDRKRDRQTDRKRHRQKPRLSPRDRIFYKLCDRQIVAGLSVGAGLQLLKTLRKIGGCVFWP